MAKKSPQVKLPIAIHHPKTADAELSKFRRVVGSISLSGPIPSKNFWDDDERADDSTRIERHDSAERAMSVVTIEAVIEDGQIRLPPNVRLPDQTKVYIVIPGMEVEQVVRLASPRLARPEQIADFTLEVVEAAPDAGV